MRGRVYTRNKVEQVRIIVISCRGELDGRHPVVHICHGVQRGSIECVVDRQHCPGEAVQGGGILQLECGACNFVGKVPQALDEVARVI